ncbi:hypothetical protein [Frankia sp. R82]|uniref:hypothetical protein n=1 Tax=Frankia sp. R82 TaxID=2950553 RepID=UPI00204384F2|nr:hypothetical protein [Frankia sp. R82]MCM3886790.1 hypothetical protein [Frankia sp. R82]
MRIIGRTRTAPVVAAAFGLTMALGSCQGGQSGQSGAATATRTSIDVLVSPTPGAAVSPTAIATPSTAPPVTRSPKAIATAHPTTTADTASTNIAAVAAAVKREPGLAPDGVVESVVISSTDPTWAAAGVVSPTAGGVRALLHRTGGAWKVVDFGSAEVGCTGGPSAAILAELGLDCPS